MRLVGLVHKFDPILVCVIVLGLLQLLLRVQSNQQSHGWRLSTVWHPLLCLAIAGLCWHAVVTIWVPEPYLDEVFHIPQAQKYCQGRFLEWDDKITTPPGLYILSYVLLRMGFIFKNCSAEALRLTNWLAIIFTPFVALQCRRLIEARLAERASDGRKSRPFELSAYALHTGLNIALFPLLFFFSGLYYTDVFSTFVVLLAYQNHLARVSTGPISPWSDALVVLLGVGALFMRQTNVFWVVVFMGGLEAVHKVKLLRPPPTSFGHSDRETRLKFFLWRYSQGEVHDPPLNEAGLEDVFLCGLSIGIAVCCNVFRVLRQIWAHIVVMALFVGFVAWNGSVVLGDKTNHVATIHLAQMLYIWPLFAFFSAPLLFPRILQPVLSFFEESPSTVHDTSKQPTSTSVITLLNLVGYASLAPLFLAIVQYNTVIHPFTLADNRHYMFYIFRYSILRAGWVRYALVPAYISCVLLCWKVLGGLIPSKDSDNNTNSPSSSVVHSATDPDAHDDLSSPTATSYLGPSLSTALIWLLTTALSLITAPLVEPRYFILPWVFWRLLVPSWSVPRGLQKGWPLRFGGRYDVRLWAETAWFVLVNMVTMYIFITRPFFWRNEDGSLADGGRVQRFMW
ncbi:family 59 glycosyltransferase [Cryphonectria parasitica EP155]|uniref:Dol-P-Glc:Glc(2)Man(9)GlcNAc(2)-PP-Dol alpha-1,2-glucosyltransferase n=1 Tax=Cryphonectria parasitica (strain ATCC 38755 / EP155) TaxID=660469 RepID=A0A9P4Y652_CRYP1|nr:family 59 glycosyltransferase [Cryphonectria parasitica EP155]KAF3767200.1 family 59 glycosyltransferase [Cryphonectria parasitica EP155]